LHGQDARAALFALIGFAAAGCLGPRVAYPPVPPPPVAGRAPVPPVAPIPIVSTGAAVPVFWSIRPGRPPMEIANFFVAHPRAHAGIIFPDRFFADDGASHQAKDLLAQAVARGQIEILLQLPSRPVLALIDDSDRAKLSTGTAVLPPRYHWPADVADQAVQAKSLYRRRWRVNPAVLEIPWGAAVGPELEPLSRMGLKWFYAGSKGRPGVYDAGGATIVVGAPFPAKSAARRVWPGDLLVPDEHLPRFRASVQVETTEELSALDAVAEARGWRMMTPSEAAAYYPRPVEKWTPSDLSPWIGGSEANRAWQLLGLTRQAVEDFKNSGRADVKTLDRAVREIYGIESGTAFLELGAGAAPARVTEAKREFLASLEQVFRFLGIPAPPSVRQGFSGGGEASGGETGGFLVRKERGSLVVRDDAKDDRGPGDYFYPTGSAIPTGAWDLRSFRVTPSSTDVTFQWELAALANPGRAPYGFSLELIDTYIDINHLPGAGSEALLPGRPGVAEPQDAWEYALSVDGWGARLYQPAQGGGPLRMAVFPVKLIPPGTLEVAVPRKDLRGEPLDWGFAVVVMGRSPSSSGGSEPAPMPVKEQPGPDNFGGAMPGRSAPPFLDLLTEGSVQNEVLDAYKQGRDVVLPFVRAEE